MTKEANTSVLPAHCENGGDKSGTRCFSRHTKRSFVLSVEATGQIAYPSRRQPNSAGQCYALLTVTADGEPLQVFFSNVSVKLVGSDTRVNAE